MNHRRLTIPAAVVGCLGIALAPAFAEASTSSQTTAKHATAGLAASPLKTAHYTFDSPLSKSVFHKSAVAHSATSPATDSGPNPDLGIGVGGLAVSSHDIEVFVTVGGLTTGTGTVTLDWGDDSTQYTDTITGSTSNGGLQEIPVPIHDYSALDVYTLTASVTDNDGDAASNKVDADTGSDFTPFGPQRILDSRKDEGFAGPLGANDTASLQVVGAKDAAGDEVPKGVTAVVLNATVTESTSNSYLTVYGDEEVNGEAQENPGTSNLNYGTGEVIPNSVFLVPSSVEDTANDSYDSALYLGGNGTAQVILDMFGIFAL